MSKYKVRLIKNKGQDIYTPQFILTYSTRSSNSMKAGYDILSKLKGDNDLLIEVNGSLLLGGANPDKVTKDFLDNVRNLDLEYSLKQVNIPVRPILSLLSPNNEKARVTYDILAYIPHEVWKNNFINFIPQYGARYYITNKIENPKELIENIRQMTDKEKYEYFNLIAYHAATLCQFGLQSTKLDENDLREILSI